MTKNEAEAAIKKHGGIRPAARALGMDHKKLWRLVRAGQSKAESVAKTAKVARTLAEFRATYDKDTIVPAKIRAALSQLRAGWEYEADFVRRAGISFSDLGNYRAMFEVNCVNIRRDGKRAWTGNVKLAQQMKEVVG